MVQFRCSCGKVLKAKAEYAGRILKCPKCEAKIRVPAPSGTSAAKPAPTKNSKRPAGTTTSKKKRSRPAPPPEEEEYEELEEYTEDDAYDSDYEADDYGSYDDYEAPALPKRKKKSNSKKPKKEDKAAASSGDSAVSPKVLYPLLGLSALVVIVVISLIGRSIMNASQANAVAMAVPEKFSKWQHEHGGLASEYPDGWELKSGGGTSGIPPWVSFENEVQEVRIAIRGSTSGTAISDIVSGGGVLPGELGENIPDELDPIAGVHRYQYEKISADYDEYEESEPQKIDSRFGEGRISDFTGTKLFSSSYGVRATLVSTRYQYNVICRCPQDRLDEYRPIFKRIIQSIGN